MERIKELEGQLCGYEDTVRKNVELQHQVRSFQEENRSVLERYSSLNERVKAFIAKEESSRKELESELHSSQMKLHSAVLDKDRLANENARMKSDLEMVEAELGRLRKSCEDSIDRSLHERLINDLRSEVRSVRQALEESVPPVVHEKVLMEVSDLKSRLNERGSLEEHLRREIARLGAESEMAKSRELELQFQIKSHVAENTSLQEVIGRQSRELNESKLLIEDGRKYHFVAEALKESVKRTTELSLDADRCRENEIRLSEEIQRFQEYNSNTAGSITALKRDLLALKAEVVNQAATYKQCLADGATRFQTNQSREIQSFITGLWNMLRKNGVLRDGIQQQPKKLDELVNALKSSLKLHADSMAACKRDAECLKSELRQRDEIIKRLQNSVDTFERGRANEGEIISKLRNSIESAELQLLRTKESRISYTT